MIAGLAATCLLLATCGDDDTAGSRTPDDNSGAELENGYVGTVEGADAFVAIVVSSSNAAVYACDGDGGVAEYFWGPVEDMTAIELDSLTGGSVRAELVDGAFTGTLTLPSGAEHAFTTELADGDAGMYLVVGEQAVAADVSAGWIIDNDGAERGALIRDGSFLSTPTFDRDGLVLEDEGFAMTKLVVGPDSVEPSDIVAPDSIVAPDNIISPNNTLRIPSPAGPIPIPLPHGDRTKATKVG